MLEACFVVEDRHPAEKSRYEGSLKTPTSVRGEICWNGNTNMGRKEALYVAISMSSCFDFGCEERFGIVVGYGCSK